MIPESLVSLPETQSFLRIGLVTRFLQDKAEIALDGEILTAVSTTGCIVDPRPGDRVVLFFPEGHPPVILSIVAGDGSNETAPRTMRFPEGLVMNVSGRPFTLRAQGGFEVESPATRIRGKRFTGEFSECEVVSERLSLTGGVLSFMGQRITQIAKTLDRVAEWLHDRARDSIREIDALDQHVSGETLIESESIVSIQSKTALVSTQELVKIDSNQIHLG
jgi:hypothetical protein